MDRDIGHMAKLANVELTPEEKIRLEKDLKGILAYADQVREIDTSGVEEMTQTAPEINRVREDVVPASQQGGPKKTDDERAEEVAGLRNAFPQEERGYAKVPLVIKKYGK
ncbi:MAG: Asp-tRNA(Asn)/Glu-tRNA(Gln) amidotransferase subunit GatC [Patescibacteria group bacterium]